MLSLRILYRPDDKKLNEIHTKLGPEYANRVLPGIANELLKDVIAQYDAGELITQRELVSHQIGDSLTVRAKNFNIIVEDVALTDVAFGPEFAAAIEAKQVGKSLTKPNTKPSHSFLFLFFMMNNSSTRS